ncbi:MAG: methyltransferase domain-containing protein [Acutalibacteraceae bacterium]|nr:methyltransferase domain-containing protein [Oscillospiraceae bacterium]
MHSKVPGDTKEMVNARRDFLRAGYYRPFADKLGELVLRYASDGCNIVDAGCGEGYYTESIYFHLRNNAVRADIAGVDISRAAVRLAAKSCKDIEYAVASVFDMPLPDGKADIVTNIFAPIVEKEFLRILRPGGVLIIAVPGEYHLWEMKTLIYDEPYVNEMKHTEYAGFDFIERVPVKGKITIDGNRQIENLFLMTPYYWKTGVEGSRRAAECEKMMTQIHFDFLIYKKT